MRNLDPRRARWIKFRMAVLCGLLTCGLASVVSSAYNIQIVHGSEWRQVAEKQRQRRLKVQPTRGSIVDRNGEPLAVSVDVPSAAVNVAEMIRGVPPARVPAFLDAAAVKLSQALGLQFAEVQQKLRSQRRFVWLKRRLAQPEVTALRALMDPRRSDGLRGVMVEGEGHRFYPGREALWGLIGFVGADGNGLDGLEKALDEDLKGSSDPITALRDRKGTLLFGDGLEDERALSGDDVHLALDLGLQFQAQEDLEAAVRAFEAKAGSAVVLDPNTGEILAMCSAPAFNSNDYADSPVEARRHHATADRVEPGSTIKIFTVAAALHEGKLQPTEQLFCENGAWSIGGITIHDTHPEGMLTPSQVIAKSSNICAAKIGLALGEAGLYNALKRFGFGEPPGLGLPGEAGGVLRAKGRPWYDVEVASASFGQGISVTTLQLAMAMGAVANGGRLYEPLLVRRVVSAGGAIVREDGPTVRREVVSPVAARLVTEMMTGVVEEGGTGREAYIPGYRVAGKTATAQKADPATGKYHPDRFVSSFVGFVPAQKPRFVVAVVLDEPWVAHLGGQVAAPVFRRISMRALARFGVAPSGDLAKTPVTFPLEDPTPRVYADAEKSKADDVTGPLGAFEASAGAPPAGSVVNPVVLGTPPKPAATGPAVMAAAIAAAAHPVLNGTPSPGSSAPTGSAKPPTAAEVGANLALVPDLQGMPAREAIRVLQGVSLLPSIEGSGLVSRQEPAAGEVVLRGSAIRLTLEATP